MPDTSLRDLAIFTGALPGNEIIYMGADPSGTPVPYRLATQKIAEFVGAGSGTGGGNFTPSAANLYTAILALLREGSDIDITGNGSDRISIALALSGQVRAFWNGTQTQYDAITAKSSTTLYLIDE